ncbi:hypothetical protein GCM10009785_13990 [Brooklawnia cerclae]|uniref:Uncharacterized protein n=1 Tax=Brooklawnia cerclae TaxID=349934 RepID=A0ABX0SMP0_9ACTN|nr:hypothetical protein [Brooklawnia cerclae]NIH58031.1 hypothetical protein [Brooklawnia cerclae]
MKHSAVAVPIAALALLLAGCGGGGSGVSDTPTPTPTPTPEEFSVLGYLTIDQAAIYASDGDSCTGYDGYSDIGEGTQVKVSDASGKVIAIGDLSSGTARDNYPQLQGTDACEFMISAVVPVTGDDIYGIEVGSRGVVNFERETWGDITHVDLTLG